MRIVYESGRQEQEKYLRQQASAHPVMEPADVHKMLYQAVYGAEHLLKDVESARKYFQKEYEDVIPRDEEEPLWEQIGTDVYRVNLREWKKKNLPPEWLFSMFAGSAEMSGECCGKTSEVAKQEKMQEFFQYIDMAYSLSEEGIFPFSAEKFAEYSVEYQKELPRPVHHSESYRRTQQPSYRLINGKFLRLIPLLEQMQTLKNNGNEKVIVAIDGRCASGKSTMAEMLSRIVGASVIHMDDFYLPAAMRTKERLAQPGGNVHRERFLQEVMPGLEMGEDFAYRRFDCRMMDLGEERKVMKSWAYVVEGAYSHHPELGEYADIKVFSNVEYEEQLRRIEARDGGRCLPMFKERWIPFEETYFAAFSVRENADMVL